VGTGVSFAKRMRGEGGQVCMRAGFVGARSERGRRGRLGL
jgi:hypothetical protein